MFLFIRAFIYFVLLFLPSLGHALTPSADQLQMFQSLSDSEKKALLGQVGGMQNNVSNEPVVETPTVVPIIKEVIPKKNEKLMPFGSFLFAGNPTTFSPVNNIPVPTDYVLGPGDQLKISLFGTKNESYELVVDRNGEVSIPNIGPVVLLGMSFSEAKSLLTSKLKSLGVGVNSSITMGALRSFRIFVLGESRTPGSYLVSGMATITHALYVSGGLTDIASYRNVQLKRKGRLIKTLDLYDLLLKGDTSGDLRLQPGDTVFIPKLSKQVSIYGQVLKPALYEIKKENTLEELVKLAGGFNTNAFSKSLELSRITTPQTRQKFSVDFTSVEGKSYSIKSGDKVFVPEVISVMHNLVKLSGEVARSRLIEWQPGFKLLDLLPERNYFTNDADLSLLIIKRQSEIAGTYEVLKVDWVAAKQLPQSKNNLVLQPRDEVIVLSIKDKEKRRENLDELLALLDEQASTFKPSKKVSVSAGVKYPGTYPLVEGMRLVDLLNMGGELMPSAMLNAAEVTRYTIIDGERRYAETLVVDLNKALRGDLDHNISLKSYDALTIKQVSDWSDSSSTVYIKGEVAFPGAYVVKPGDTLQNVLTRAGGFTEWAAPQNAIFTRAALKLKERREMDAMADDLEKGLLFALKTESEVSKDSASIVTLGQTLIQKIKETPSLGRLVIGLNPEKTERYQASLQLELRDGDELIVPKRSNEVVVMGEVSRPASLLYQTNLTVEEYLQQAGGITKRADNNGIYIVRGDGSILKYNTGLFDMSSSLELKPGDTIIVPMDVERVSPLVTWTAVSKILSNLAIGAAALQTIGVIN